MRKLISAKLAGKILLWALGLLAAFHVLVLLRVVPSDIIWGGQIGGSAANLMTLEIISLVITLLFAAIVASKMNYILAGKFRIPIAVGMWIVFGYMILNLVGNLASAVSFENLVFAPITLVMALLALRLAIEK